MKLCQPLILIEFSFTFKFYIPNVWIISYFLNSYSYYFIIRKINIFFFFFSDLTPANKSVLESVLEFVLDSKQFTNPYALIQASEIEEIRAHVCIITYYLGLKYIIRHKGKFLFFFF